MAPLHAGGSHPQRMPAPRPTPTTQTNPLLKSTTMELPPSPDSDANAEMSPLNQTLTMESEGDLESETDLPTMTPPSTKQLPFRPRNISPSNGTTGRGLNSNSNINMFTVPPMQRAHSSPGADTNTRTVTPTHQYPRRPISPLSSGRRRSPLRTPFEDSYPGSSWSGLAIEPNIPENAELEISTPPTPENEFGNLSAIPTYTNFSHTFPRSRRRPASPLHQSASAPSLQNSARIASLHASGASSPFSALSAAKFANEPYPTYGYSFSSTSSMPSTPTSLRSRSPSISSLDTIEDTPDAEEAAMLEEEQGKSRSGDESDTGYDTRRKSLDLRATTLRSNKDRKRWSVCGAERRADFSLAPIEE